MSIIISYYSSSYIRIIDEKEIINPKEYCELSYILKFSPSHINEINKSLYLNKYINLFPQ
ncbi:TPA: hypothetical protein MII03_26440 [Klebsiella pneumoniae]|nr:hypothetical protein [Klebsiella pneumoniae]HBX8417576.1 hypothetical protein [Klebsiella pneumoniae]